MSVQLLDKTRKINKLLNNNIGYSISLNDLTKLLGRILFSNIVLFNSHGRIIGIYQDDNIPAVDYILGALKDDNIDEELNERLLSVLSTKENVNLNMLGLEGDNYEHYDALIIPIDISGERLGTVFAYRLQNQFDIDDIIVGEYAAMIAGMELLHEAGDASADEGKKDELIRSAVKSMSASEQYAAKCVLDELSSTEGTIVTSNVAIKYGITRSVIVNAIKKLCGAGVIKSQSRGTKGTSIHINNESIIQYLKDVER